MTFDEELDVILKDLDESRCSKSQAKRKIKAILKECAIQMTQQMLFNGGI
jgi:hypothetical protein